MTHLMNIPRGSIIKHDDKTITFHRLDGLYSYCTVAEAPETNNTIHLHAMTPLKKQGDHFVIDTDTER